MVVIRLIFAADVGKSGWYYLHISLVELVETSNMYIIVSLVIQFEISLVLSEKFGFLSHETSFGRMVVIPPIFTSNGETKLYYLYISLTELAVNSNLYIIASVVIQFEISLVLSGKLSFLSHDTSLEEWSSFHQYSHQMVRPSKCSNPHIDLAELAANSNLYIIVSFVIQFEISSVLYQESSVFFPAWY